MHDNLVIASSQLFAILFAIGVDMIASAHIKSLHQLKQHERNSTMFELSSEQKFFNEVILELRAMETLGTSKGAVFSESARQAVFDAASSMSVTEVASMVAELQRAANITDA